MRNLVTAHAGEREPAHLEVERVPGVGDRILVRLLDETGCVMRAIDGEHVGARPEDRDTVGEQVE